MYIHSAKVNLIPTILLNFPLSKARRGFGFWPPAGTGTASGARHTCDLREGHEGHRVGFWEAERMREGGGEHSIWEKKREKEASNEDPRTRERGAEASQEKPAPREDYCLLSQYSLCICAFGEKEKNGNALVKCEMKKQEAMGRVPPHAHRALVSSREPPTLTVIPPPRPGENGHGLDPAVAAANAVKVPTRVEWDNDSTGVYVDDDEEALLMTAQDGVRIFSSFLTFKK